MVNQKRFLNREINNKLIDILLVRFKMYLTAINNFSETYFKARYMLHLPINILVYLILGFNFLFKLNLNFLCL